MSKSYNHKRNSEQPEVEQHRHECEVRYVLAMINVNAMKAYMDGCEKKRGKKAADRLRDDVRAALIEKRKNYGGGRGK